MLAFLVFARTNWKLLAGGLAVLAILAGLWGIYEKGLHDEQAKQDKASAANLRDRSAIDDAVRIENDLLLCRRLGGGASCDSLQNGR